MRVLFWLSIGLDRQATSGHLLTAIIEALCREGHSVHILQKDTGGDLSAIPDCLSSYPVTTDRIPFRAADKKNFIARYLTELKYLCASKKLIRSDYDAVFIQSTTVGGFFVWTIRRRIKNAIVTFNVQDVFPYNLYYTGKLKLSDVVFRILAAVQRYGYRHSDHIITISEDMKELLAEDGTSKDKIKVIYNWSYQDEPYEKLDLSPVKHLFEPSCFNVVYAGNIGFMQNIDVLLDAAERMKGDESIRFHIIGDGVYKSNLEKRADMLGLKNVSFWPMQPPELAPLVYASADVNVIPLARGVFRTALPSKTATCMACGRPIVFVIGTESKFGRRVSAETGCPLIESNDVEGLVEAIRTIRSAANRIETTAFFREHMGVTRNSRQYAEQIISKY